VAKSYQQIFINFQNQFDAVQDASDNIMNSGFIDNVIAALSPQKQPIALTVLELLAQIPLDFIQIAAGTAQFGLQPRLPFRRSRQKTLQQASKPTASIRSSTPSLTPLNLSSRPVSALSSATPTLQVSTATPAIRPPPQLS
jgi:hypothetical protein